MKEFEGGDNMKDMKEGIYYVQNISNGKELKWIAEFKEGLPEARKIIELDLYRNKLYEALEEVLNTDVEITKVMIVNALFNILEKEQK